MNIDIRHILILFITLIFSGFLMFYLTSCSPEYHFNKFKDKGGKITCDTVYVSKTDTLKIKGINGKDSIIYITTTTPCNCPEVTIQTRWQTKFDNKRFKDSLKVISRMYRDSLKYATKQNKVNQRFATKQHKQNKKVEKTKLRQENKKFPWLWFFIAISLVFTFLTIKQFKR
jgi:hypothetical protein